MEVEDGTRRERLSLFEEDGVGRVGFDGRRVRVRLPDCSFFAFFFFFSPCAGSGRGVLRRGRALGVGVGGWGTRDRGIEGSGMDWRGGRMLVVRPGKRWEGMGGMWSGRRGVQGLT